MSTPTIQEVVKAWQAWQRQPSVETRDAFVGLMGQFEDTTEVDAAIGQAAAAEAEQRAAAPKDENTILAGGALR